MSANRLSVKEKSAYALGDTASNLFFQSFMFYLMFFYTDVFGISAAAAGTMLAVTRLWDTFNDPIMGIIADRTKTRWGKFRPYLLWGAIPFGIIGVAVFTTPDLSPERKLIYAYITYTLMMMVYTFVNIPYSALMGVITPDSIERTSVSSYRFVGAFSGGLIIQFFTTPLVKKLGGDNPAVGYQWTMAVFAIAAAVMFFITFAGTKERVIPKQSKRTPLKSDLKDLMTNKPWLILFFVGIFTLSYVSIRNGSILYYFKYYAQREDLANWFMISGTGANLLGVFATHWLSERFGKGRLYCILMIGSALMLAGFYFIPPSNLGLLFTVNIISALLAGPTAPLVWAMYADCADYSEWKNGRRATGLIFSAATFAQKAGWTVGGALVGWILASYGYQANMEQSADSIAGIRLMMSVYPAIGAILAAACFSFYPLREPLMAQITKELDERSDS